MFAVASNVSSCTNSLLNVFKTSVGALSAAFMTPVRYRYNEEKPEILPRRWGYQDKLAWRGPLPRIQTSKRPRIPPFVPKNSWSERRALFGQNDYIDILGDDESISPVKFAYGVPSWLRGFRGSEYMTLLRKRAFFGRRIAGNPHGQNLMRKRLKFLYRRLNYKTENNMDPRVMRR